MCSWTLPCASSLVPSILHLSRGFQWSPTLNRQPYEGRLPLISWWRKSSNMTVGQSSLISLAHYCYDWHPGSRCGWTCNQLTSKVDGNITGSQLRWSILTYCATPQSGNRVSISLGNSGLCWTVFARNRDTAVPAEGNGDLQTLICVLAWDPDDVPHCRILSPDKTEWQLILATLCGWRLCFMADQLWFLTRRWMALVLVVSCWPWRKGEGER